MNFRAIKTKERLPNFNKRVFFFNESYNNYKGFIKEYEPSEKIPLKKGAFIEIKDCEMAKQYLINNFEFWLEKIK